MVGRPAPPPGSHCPPPPPPPPRSETGRGAESACEGSACEGCVREWPTWPGGAGRGAPSAGRRRGAWPPTARRDPRPSRSRTWRQTIQGGQGKTFRRNRDFGFTPSEPRCHSEQFLLFPACGHQTLNLHLLMQGGNQTH